MEKGILGQDQIVQVLTEYLQDSPLLKVVALIGDTSVEKSYTVDLIKKKFRRRSDNGFSSLYPNFVVLENLRAEHLTDVINYVKTFEEAYGNRQITILAVFKVGQIDDSTMRNTDLNRIINTVKDTFIEANISIKIISYEPLTENALEKHIINTAKDIRLTFSQDEINIIKRGLTEDNTDSRKAYGL
ncbi:unnamed protein product [Lasius platythorax]|uniref:Uncharacterized protein n=2 Tax=Lasius TaxID=488720 RepID=A0A0J7MX70_LASNI|nr:hypothetical protein RF55_16700 [Lasius niger]